MTTSTNSQLQLALEKGDKFTVTESFKGFEVGKVYTISRRDQFRWSGEYCYYAITYKNDARRTPELTLFHESDFDKIIKL